MRVCQVIEASSGGSVRVALDLTKELIAAGDQVTFIYSPTRADQAAQEDIAQISQAKFIPFPMCRHLGLHDLFAAVRLWRLLRQEGPFDVIHAHSSKAGGLVRILRFFLPRTTALVYSPHAFVTMDSGASRIYGWIERLLGYLCDAVVAVSQGEKDHAVQALKIPQAKVQVIPNGIDYKDIVPREQARQALGVAAEDFVIGFVGRFAPQKNLGRLVETFALVRERIPFVRFVIIGDGPLRDELEIDLNVHGLSNKTSLRINQRARPLIPAFDALLCSSDYEGLSIVFLEAMTAGIPLVTTPVAGCDETVIDGKTGFIARAFSAEALAQKLVKLAGLSGQEILAIKNAAQEHSKKFQVGAMFESFRVLYQAVVQARRS